MATVPARVPSLRIAYQTLSGVCVRLASARQRVRPRRSSFAFVRLAISREIAQRRCLISARGLGHPPPPLSHSPILPPLATDIASKRVGVAARRYEGCIKVNVWCEKKEMVMIVGRSRGITCLFASCLSVGYPSPPFFFSFFYSCWLRVIKATRH